MAVGEARPAVTEPVRGSQWTLAFLPAFPIVLLVLRLWQLSRQDLDTMLLLVQNVGPLDLVSSLVITLIWVPPVVVLVVRVLGLLYQVSAGAEAKPSWLARGADRTPDWAVAAAVMWAAAAWQAQYLPALAMVTAAIAGLTVRHRYPQRVRLIGAVCLLLPLGLAIVEYAWFGPAIVDAFRHGEIVVALLLLMPPLLAPLLAGPIPASVARVATHAPAAAGALIGPVVLGAIFLRAPVLPSVALELKPESGGARGEIVLAGVVTVDDTMTTLLDDHGAVRFVPNDRVASKTLCAGAEQIPPSRVEAHGWLVGQSALQWVLPARHIPRSGDPRCEGRPVKG